MQLNHVGINIARIGEIQHFYKNILGCVPERNFPVPLDISQQFFGIDNKTEAYIVRYEDMLLELFVYDKPLKTGYAHLCLEVKDREKIVRKCVEVGYPVMRKERENGDLLFIKDKAGNVFELKNKRI
jgi:catechol 2,3-dioxygenase-like lactoylglutathione lyase family enzyme